MFKLNIKKYILITIFFLTQTTIICDNNMAMPIDMPNLTVDEMLQMQQYVLEAYEGMSPEERTELAKMMGATPEQLDSMMNDVAYDVDQNQKSPFSGTSTYDSISSNTTTNIPKKDTQNDIKNSKNIKTIEEFLLAINKVISLLNDLMLKLNDDSIRAYFKQSNFEFIFDIENLANFLLILRNYLKNLLDKNDISDISNNIIATIEKTIISPLKQIISIEGNIKGIIIDKENASDEEKNLMMAYSVKNKKELIEKLTEIKNESIKKIKEIEKQIAEEKINKNENKIKQLQILLEKEKLLYQDVSEDLSRTDLSQEDINPKNIENENNQKKLEITLENINIILQTEKTVKNLNIDLEKCFKLVGQDELNAAKKITEQTKKRLQEEANSQKQKPTQGRNITESLNQSIDRNNKYDKRESYSENFEQTTTNNNYNDYYDEDDHEKNLNADDNDSKDNKKNSDNKEESNKDNNSHKENTKRNKSSNDKNYKEDKKSKNEELNEKSKKDKNKKPNENSTENIFRNFLADVNSINNNSSKELEEYISKQNEILDLQNEIQRINESSNNSKTQDSTKQYKERIEIAQKKQINSLKELNQEVKSLEDDSKKFLKEINSKTIHFKMQDICTEEDFQNSKNLSEEKEKRVEKEVQVHPCEKKEEKCIKYISEVIENSTKNIKNLSDKISNEISSDKISKNNEGAKISDSINQKISNIKKSIENTIYNTYQELEDDQKTISENSWIKEISEKVEKEKEMLEKQKNKSPLVESKTQFDKSSTVQS